MIFVDTSAFYALLAANDPNHHRAAASFKRVLGSNLLTSSFVFHETVSLVQRRLGLEAVAALWHDLVPACEFIWLEPEQVERSMTELLKSNTRLLSLTDVSSFVCMRDRGIHRAFAFDEHFVQAGFELLS